MNITYTREGNSDDPDLVLLEGQTEATGIWAIRRRRLSEGGVQTSLLQHDDCPGRLAEHLAKTQQEAEEMMEMLWQADSRAGARHRGAERGQSDKVDSPDEQYQSIGGGDSKERTNTDIGKHRAEADDLPATFLLPGICRKRKLSRMLKQKAGEPVSLPEHQISDDGRAAFSGEKRNYRIYEDPEPAGKKQHFKQDI
ncbi:MAG: hypothetical protein V8Q42_07675 [Anaerovoracaceae bacterium]